jgi:hypothetical protein
MSPASRSTAESLIDDRACSAGPWLTVSDEHGAGARLSEVLQCGEMAFAVGGRSPDDDARPGPPGVGIERDNGVTRDHHVAIRQVQRAVTERVAGVGTTGGEPGTGSDPPV